MKTIDLTRIREALPSGANVTLRKTDKGTPYLDVRIYPGLYVKGSKEEERDLEEVLQWHMDIIGKENIMEIDTQETGSRWNTYLKKQPYDFIGLQDKDVDSFTGLPITELATTKAV
ncbi:hypothetical protein [Rufibacter quisquiliarum]|uniref:Uncharacterized protein n=1 Tax=Rufibacter quisquiliarum TaxID=1549639 RepID=A0A839GKM2_9BACT|nr:hypothetical protein [Rufibacter quisquiliarum]MBA9078333.1 hypothetical protein [Rufibacter quisquiliarum]